MLVNYLLFGLGVVIILLLGGILLKMIASGKPIFTKETDAEITKRLARQNELNREIGNQLKTAGWWQTRKWKKELGLELYSFYLKNAD